MVAPREKPVRFGVIGLNHNHIYGMTDLLLQAGGELAAFFAAEPELVAEFARRYPQAPRARSAEEILESSSIDLIASASIPDERAGLGVAASQVANFAHPEYPELEDFGDMLLRGDRGRGYIRVDWFTPDGLDSWGDGRLTILGTDGYIELRKYIDLEGRPGGDHLFLVDKHQTRYIDCSSTDLPFGRQLLNDVRDRTETAMSQAHAFLASELSLQAQLQATHARTLRAAA